MHFSTNKEKGNCGLAFAIAYFVKSGYNVSIPLNDTQDYDLIVELDDVLFKIQCKATSQKTKYGVTTVPLRSMGGTKGLVYKTLKNTNIDFLFVINSEMKMWLLPKKEITQINSINLKDDSMFRIE